MNPKFCLNCNEELNGYFCSNCGQPASTQRFALQNVLTGEKQSTHHSVLNYGLLYTLRELLLRPGHAIREYIVGKRINHFNYIRLILLLIVIEQVLKNIAPISFVDLADEGVREIVDELEQFINHYIKLIELLQIPIYAGISFLWFRKASLNYAEHLVLNAYRIAGSITLLLPFYVLMVFLHNIQILDIILNVMNVLTLVYNLWYYYQFFSAYGYRRGGLIFRTVGVTVSIYIIIFLAIFLLMIILR